VTKQELLFAPIPLEKFDLLTKEELIILVKGEQSLRLQMEKEVKRLRALNDELKQRSFLMGEQLFTIKGKLFGKSSEKSPRQDGDAEPGKYLRDKKVKVQLPSLRYPNAPLIEKDVDFVTPPTCGCCSAQMADSGMTEDSEYLTVIPAQFYVVRQKRHKYRCEKCHGDIKTAAAIPRITPGSGYSDEMIVDVALSKYCDLIPVERYKSIAGRAGLKKLPQNSLIESTHRLADFVRRVYERLKSEITSSRILHADETPHRMLEGDAKCSWYLWGFSSQETSYFECHDTRSGDIASRLLTESKCEYLISDVFSGYNKAVSDTNVARRALSKEKGIELPKLVSVYCNAHARRKFKVALESFAKEAQVFIDEYKAIYLLEDLVKTGPPGAATDLRLQMLPHFEKMRDFAMAKVSQCSEKSSLGRAISYFLKNYGQFTLFTKNPDLPIDNNSQERLLRNPVIGRKTWYGTHSKRGAETAAVLFSLVESCKLNKINPREYFKNLVEDLHQGKPAYTPKEFKDLNGVH